MSAPNPGGPPGSFNKSAFEKTASQYERKLARQRQLELMEAAASGTAPSMELDVGTSGFTSHVGRPPSPASSGSSSGLSSSSTAYLRSRNQDTARRFLADEDEPMTTSQPSERQALHGKKATAASAGSSLYFDRNRPAAVNQSVNLMDHDAGVYEDPNRNRRHGSFVVQAASSLRSSFSGLSNNLFQTTAAVRSSNRNRPTPVNQAVNLMERPAPVNQAVNLMDHEAGVYEDPSRSRRQGSFIVQAASSLRSAFSGLFQATTSVRSHEAGSTFDGDTLFTGDVYQKRTKRKASAWSPWLRKHRRALALLLATLAGAMVVCLTVNMLVIYSHTVTEKRLRSQNTARFNSILDHVLDAGVSHTDVFLRNPGNSAELHALKWVAYSDPAMLAPDDPILLQRYALAVFFYSSFLQFQRSAGKQKAIDDGDRQWEGVPNPGWIRHDYWLTGKGICAWHGVECEERVNPEDDLKYRQYNDNDDVIALNLTANHVYGSLPPEFKGLRKAVLIDLSHNRMHGTLPGALGHMTALQWLNLQRNDLTGRIPTEFGFMSSVKHLDLSRNRFSGSIPTQLNRLYHIQNMALHHNSLTGSIPGLGDCHEMISLQLNDNHLSGEFPFAIAKTKTLRELRLHQNQLTGTLPPELMTIHGLRFLQVNDNHLKGQLPEHIFLKLSHLEDFQCQHNQLTGSIPSSFASLTQLSTLHLNSNQFTGTLVGSDWNDLRFLKSLHLYENHGLTGSIPPELGHLTELVDLWLNDCNFTGSIPRQLGQLHKLQTLYLENNQFTGVISNDLGACTELETARFYGNKFTKSMPEQICALTKEHQLSFLAADCSLNEFCESDGNADKCETNVKCDCCHKCY